MKPIIITPDGQRLEDQFEEYHEAVAILSLAGWRLFLTPKTGEIRQLWHERVYNPSEGGKDEN